jgi:hypothetical protein
MTKVIDFVIGQEQWLVWVNVTLMQEDDTTMQERSCCFPVNPDATTTYVKKNLSRLWGLRPADQRLFLSNTGEPLFHHLLRKTSVRRRATGRPIHLRLQVVPLHPWMESLYEITSMGTVHERDFMLERMSIARPAGSCTCRDNNIWWALPGVYAPGQACRCCRTLDTATCILCAFSLCARCSSSERDPGRPASEDPYAALTALAKQICADLAKEVFDFCPPLEQNSRNVYVEWKAEWGDVRSKKDVFCVFPARNLGLNSPPILPKTHTCDSTPWR